MNPLFYTNSNIDLAKKLIKKTKLREGKARVSQFADGEISILLEEDVEGKEVFILGSSFPPCKNLLELFILSHTLKSNGAKKLTAFIPYFGYAKADHITPQGAPLSAKLMADMTKISGIDEVYILNIHSKMAEDFFEIPLHNMSAIPLLAKEFEKLKVNNFIVVSPDKGGVERAKEFANAIDACKVTQLEKFRPQFDEAKIVKIPPKLKGRNVVIVDDMIQSGGTIIETARSLKENGVKDIYVAVVHLVHTGGSISKLEREKNIKKLIITDSIPYEKKFSSKFIVLPIEEVIAQKIKELLK